jgi:hypothetical protein
VTGASKSAKEFVCVAGWTEWSYESVILSARDSLDVYEAPNVVGITPSRPHLSGGSIRPINISGAAGSFT